MFSHYLITAIRNLQRDRIYTLINALGLSVGLATCMLVLLFVHREFRYDGHVGDGDRVYRVIRQVQPTNGAPYYSSGTLGQLAPRLQDQLPEIEAFAQFYSRWTLVSHDGQGYMHYLNLVNPGFLDFFGYHLKPGAKPNPLEEPFSVVITETLADKMFGRVDPVGKVISVLERGVSLDYTITGVVKIPGPSHLEDRVDLLTTTVPPVPAVQRFWETWRTDPGATRYTETYLRLAEGTVTPSFQSKLATFVERSFGTDAAGSLSYHLQPLDRVHLHSYPDYGIQRRWGNIQQIYLFVGIGFVVLIIACVNFVNLTTARAARRAREVGIRKSVGARRTQLITQLLSESVIMALLGFVIAMSLVSLALPSFNGFVQRSLVNASATSAESLSLGMISSQLWLLVCVTVATGLLAGSYPAFFLSSYQPVKVLKGGAVHDRSGAWLRKGLVVFQFGVSLVAVIATIVVSSQLNYVETKDLGFQKDEVLSLYLLRHAPELKPRYQTVKQAFSAHPNVRMSSVSGALPGTMGTRATPASLLDDGGEERQVRELAIDENFLTLFDLNLTAGRNISATTGEGKEMELVLNRRAVRSLGWANPIGKRMALHGIVGTVVGVVEDFHLGTAHQEIAPLVMHNRLSSFRYVSLRIGSGDLSETMTFIQDTWKRFLPLQSFVFVFLDDEIDRLYIKERKLRQALEVAFVLTVFVACLGLFALAAYCAEQRTKEIGVRKTLGASVPSILRLFTLDFVKLLAVSNLIAWPIAYFAVEQWLLAYAYRIEFGLWPFLIGGVLTTLIATLTVSAHAVKVATAHPVTSLRYE